jgi:hypothetical protein
MRLPEFFEKGVPRTQVIGKSSVWTSLLFAHHALRRYPAKAGIQ